MKTPSKLRGSILPEKWFAVLLILPALLSVSAVILIPLLRSVTISFQDYSLLQPGQNEWIGFKNYILLFSQPEIWEILGNTFFFVITSSLFEFIIGFCFALLLNTIVRSRNLLSGIALINWITPSVVVAFIWRWIFHGEYGIINFVLTSLNISSENIQWISDYQGAMLVVIAAHVWKQFPFMMVMILAGLQTVPRDVVESSIIDGSNQFQRFWFIVLPYLKNIILISTLLSVIRNFQSFTIIWLITEGGPATRTTTLSIDVFRKAFMEFDMGSASAVGTLWLLFLALIALFYIRMMSKSRVYD